MSSSTSGNDNIQPVNINDVGKTALYYEYTSVNVKEDHVIEKTLTALVNDPDVASESIRIVTYYLVQKFFIKTVNEKKENIDLVSQIPGAFKKMIDTLPPETTDKKVLVKYFNLYLSHTISTQRDQEKLFQSYNNLFRGVRNKLNAENNSGEQNIIHNKEAVIDQIYQYIDSINLANHEAKKHSKEKARKKIDFWINRIFENHVIEGALDVITALEKYSRDEIELTRQHVEFLNKYSKLNTNKISKEILQNPEIASIKDGMRLIVENIYMYIDNLAREHSDYKKFLEEIFSPNDSKFVDFFFSRFFMISAIQKHTENDIYLVEKTFRDLHLLDKFKSFFTSKIHNKIKEGREKAYYIENYFHESILEIKDAHINTYAYLTLKYLLEDTMDKIRNSDGSPTPDFQVYKIALTDFIRAKYPKFLDRLVFIFLKSSKDLERKTGNTKKSYSNIYRKNTLLLKSVFTELGLSGEFNRNILPCITGFEQSSQILKRH